MGLALKFPVVLAAVMVLGLGGGAAHSGPLTQLAQTAQRQKTLTADDLKALQQKAEQGDADAQVELASLYLTGQGVQQDYARAADWYRKAAEQGLAFAQSKLSIAYLAGKGVPQDRIEAYKWASLAAALESSDAKKTLAATRDAFAHGMTPAQLAEAETRVSEWMAAFEKRKKQESPA